MCVLPECTDAIEAGMRSTEVDRWERTLRHYVQRDVSEKINKKEGSLRPYNRGKIRSKI